MKRNINMQLFLTVCKELDRFLLKVPEMKRNLFNEIRKELKTAQSLRSFFLYERSF